VFWVRARKIETAVRALFIENRMSARDREKRLLGAAESTRVVQCLLACLRPFTFHYWRSTSAIVRRALTRPKPLGAHTQNLIFLLF